MINLTKIFKYKKNPHDDLYRTEGYTTNKTWAILTEYEPKILKTATFMTGNPPINRIIPDIEEINADYEEARIENQINLKSETEPAILLTGTTVQHEVNAYYLSMFQKIPDIKLYLHKKYNKPLVITLYGKVIGLIAGFYDSYKRIGGDKT